MVHVHSDESRRVRRRRTIERKYIVNKPRDTSVVQVRAGTAKHSIKPCQPSQPLWVALPLTKSAPLDWADTSHDDDIDPLTINDPRAHPAPERPLPCVAPTRVPPLVPDPQANELINDEDHPLPSVAPLNPDAEIFTPAAGLEPPATILTPDGSTKALQPTDPWMAVALAQQDTIAMLVALIESQQLRGAAPPHSPTDIAMLKNEVDALRKDVSRLARSLADKVEDSIALRLPPAVERATACIVDKTSAFLRDKISPLLASRPSTATASPALYTL